MTQQTLTTNNPAVIDDDQLTAITSFTDAAALLNSLGIATESMADYGTGFKVVEKDKLTGVDLIILDWRFNDGDYEGGFVSVQAVTKHGEKVIFNDGSSGVRDQLRTVTSQRIDKGHKHPQAGLAVEGGLTKSTYYRHKTTGEIAKSALTKDYEPAITFYLSA